MESKLLDMTMLMWTLVPPEALGVNELTTALCMWWKVHFDPDQDRLCRWAQELGTSKMAARLGQVLQDTNFDPMVMRNLPQISHWIMRGSPEAATDAFRQYHIFHHFVSAFLSASSRTPFGFSQARNSCTYGGSVSPPPQLDEQTVVPPQGR